jgi:hypothetical protein
LLCRQAQRKVLWASRMTARDSDRSLSSQYAILANASVISYFVDM